MGFLGFQGNQNTVLDRDGSGEFDQTKVVELRKDDLIKQLLTNPN